VRWRVAAAFDDATVAPGTTAYLRGTVLPVRGGTTVQRQHFANGTWRTVASTTVKPDGTYVFPVTITTVGSQLYRVIASPSTSNATGYSPEVTLVIG